MFLKAALRPCTHLTKSYYSNTWTSHQAPPSASKMTIALLLKHTTVVPSPYVVRFLSSTPNDAKEDVGDDESGDDDADDDDDDVENSGSRRFDKFFCLILQTGFSSGAMNNSDPSSSSSSFLVSFDVVASLADLYGDSDESPEKNGEDVETSSSKSFDGAMANSSTVVSRAKSLFFFSSSACFIFDCNSRCASYSASLCVTLAWTS